MNSSTILLYLQKDAAILSLIGTIIVITVVVLILRSTRRPADDFHKAKDKIYNIRKPYFFGLMIVLAALFTFSMWYLPYFAADEDTDIEVGVVGQQWAWMMSQDTPVKADSVKMFIGTPKITLPKDKNIQFQVTSRDVNHNFAIYNPKGHIVAEVQAMPGYVNKLEHKFTSPGTYTIVCLEYCGLAHSMMTGEIIIK